MCECLFGTLTWASPLNISISRHRYSLERQTRVLLKVGYHMPCMSAGDKSELLCSPEEVVLVLVLRVDSTLVQPPLSSIESAAFPPLSSDPNWGPAIITFSQLISNRCRRTSDPCKTGQLFMKFRFIITQKHAESMIQHVGLTTQSIQVMKQSLLSLWKRRILKANNCTKRSWKVWGNN